MGEMATAILVRLESRCRQLRGVEDLISWVLRVDRVSQYANDVIAATVLDILNKDAVLFQLLLLIYHN